MVDFTQPYIESGLVVVAPVWKTNSNAMAFLRPPFTKLMWTVMIIFFLFVEAVVWILDHRLNDEFRGPPRRQFITILWRKHPEHPRSDLAVSVVIRRAHYQLQLHRKSYFNPYCPTTLLSHQRHRDINLEQVHSEIHIPEWIPAYQTPP